MSGRQHPGQMPAWIRDMTQRAEAPAWIRNPGRTGGTGGHRPTLAERRAAYALFTALRDTGLGQPGRPGVFATMRDPDDMSPLARRLFGAGQ